jgi:hypothetical protein
VPTGTSKNCSSHGITAFHMDAMTTMGHERGRVDEAVGHWLLSARRSTNIWGQYCSTNWGFLSRELLRIGVSGGVEAKEGGAASEVGSDSGGRHFEMRQCKARLVSPSPVS